MSVDTIKEISQYLSFNLDTEVYALSIDKVKEVLEFTDAAKVPQTPGYMRGVINLRGNVVPVVDLKLKFGIGNTEKEVDTCVIITDVFLDDETVTLGLMADAVDEVFDLDPEQIEPSPKIGSQLDTEFLTGMGKKDKGFVLILDIDRIFSLDEMDRVKATGEDAALETDVMAK